MFFWVEGKTGIFKLARRIKLKIKVLVKCFWIDSIIWHISLNLRFTHVDFFCHLWDLFKTQWTYTIKIICLWSKPVLIHSDGRDGRSSPAERGRQQALPGRRVRQSHWVLHKSHQSMQGHKCTGCHLQKQICMFPKEGIWQNCNDNSSTDQYLNSFIYVNLCFASQENYTSAVSDATKGKTLVLK